MSIPYSVEDNARFVGPLDELGLRYPQAGNSGSIPKDMKFCSRAGTLKSKNASVIAFDCIRNVGEAVEEDGKA